jgi:hypothetical protein
LRHRAVRPGRDYAERVLATRGATGSFATLRALSDRLLPFWFLGWTLYRVQGLGWNGAGWDLSFVGRDFWIYRNAALALLAGADPWAASFPWNGISWHFAAPPTAAQLFVPFAVMADWIALPVFVCLCVLAAWAGLRRLGLPVWWLLFPPMTEGLLAANPQILLFGLILVGGSGLYSKRGGERGRLAGWMISRAIAVGLKSYAIVPVIARREWRAVAAVGLGGIVSIALTPNLWASYVSGFGSISSRLVAESEGGLSAALFLRPAVIRDGLPSDGMALALGLAIFGLVACLVVVAAVRDVEGAGWLAVPLLLPGAEYHLATLAIPAARRVAIWIIAIPTVPTYLLGLIVLAYEVSTGRRPIVEAASPVPLRRWLGSFNPRVFPRVGRRRSVPPTPDESGGPVAASPADILGP